MLAVPADRLPAALAELDPGNRALLDLSLRRGISDSEIGELLRKEPDEVARGRNAVLGLLADALELEGQDRRDRVRRAIAELPEEAWRAKPQPANEEPQPATERPKPPREEPQPPAEQPRQPMEAPGRAGASAPRREPPARERAVLPASTAAAQPPFAREPAPGTARRSRRGRALALIVALLITLSALAAILFGGSDDGDDSQTPRDRAEAPGGGPANERGGSARLSPLPGESGSGRLTLRPDGRLVISLRGLPRPGGSYQVWLYNDVVDAIPLGTFRDGTGRLEVRLPARARRYRFIDVSLEPADSNRNHSGDSVLRARVDELMRG